MGFDRRDFLVLHFQGDGAGLVTLSARGVADIVCTKDCTNRFRSGTMVLVTVEPSKGSSLVALGGDVEKCIDNRCVVTVRGMKTVSVDLTTTSEDAKLDARRLELIRYLWKQDTIPSWPPDFVEDLGLTLPTVPSYLGNFDATQYALEGQWATANLDHYERWAIRPLPDIGMNYLGQWDWDPIPGTGPLVPVIYFAPAVPTSKLFIVHDGHAPYHQPGHRNLVKWALDHGFGVVVIVMPWTNHDMFNDYDTLYPRSLDHGHILRMFFEATTNAITYAQGLGYTSFVMEGFSGGGWTAHFVPAVDTRIAVSYPVAGSLPFELRTPAELGDGEQQRERSIYDIVDYDDLYAMAASNGRHVTQILNEFDPCCFWSTGREAEIQAHAAAADARASGTFRTLINRGGTVHDLSAWSIQAIEDDLRGLGIIP